MSVVDDLLVRSHRLGADRRNTNYAGGNTSAKGAETDPVTGGEVEVMWIKGSGGDLATLTREGLSVLRLDRLRALVDVYEGREDEMFGAFDFCRHGLGGAAPSIDTAMHGLLDPTHVDHLHPDGAIAIAACADGERLTKEIYGERVVWVPWRRPGFQLGLDIAQIQRENPGTVGVMLGGHGITAWGATSEEAERNSLWIIGAARDHIERHGDAEPFGPVVEGRRSLPGDERRNVAAALAPKLRAIASRDVRMVGHFDDGEAVLDFLSREKLDRLAELGTSCPDHFLRTKVKPLVVEAAATDEGLAAAHERFRADYRAYYDRYAGADSPPMRGADPAIILVPGVGMFSYGRDKPTARVAGEFYVNAINVMRGAESVSTYAPIDEREKFGIEYWALEEAKLRRLPKPRRHAGRIALVTGGASGIGAAIARRLVEDGACVVVADLDVYSDDADRLVSVRADVTDAASVRDAVDAALLAFGGLDLVVNNAGLSISKPLLETTEEDWDRQHDVMAKGSFLVSQAAAKVMIDQGLGGDIVYIASKNAIVAGPDNVGYGAAKADQAHQVRLLAAELGQFGIRVNGVNPDAVVRGSGIFAGGWGAERAALHGVPEEELGAFYAQRTILKREVLPEHVADVVSALCSEEFSRTTGLIVPVDAGVGAAFLPVTRRIFAAVDIGASGGRVMAGVVESDRVTLDAVHRFDNRVTEMDGHLRWRFAQLYEEVLAGLARLPDAVSIGVDTWGVDYGLLGDDGTLLAEPIAYRDDRTAKVIDDVHRAVDPEELFAINGLQFLPFNTIYQLAAEQRGPNWSRAAHVVLLPDLIAYRLTGELRSELTNASTTGLLDVRRKQWSDALLERLGISQDLLPAIEPPGEVRGTTASGTVVTTVGSHDTASAVVGVPATTERFAYIASGTWSLVGLELEAPVLTAAAHAANFTNEIGVDGRTRFLRNVGGLWLLQECLREWKRNDMTELLDAAARLPRGGPRIDVNDPVFIPPGNMPERIAEAAGKDAMNEAEITRCVLESLAVAYTRTVHEAAELAGREVDVIHIVGGGSRNELLCRLTADAAGMPVLAGPVEATALGNVLIQARTHGVVPVSLEAIRTLLASSFPPQRYDPS